MTVHQLHPRGLPLPFSWLNRLHSASSEADVVNVARDFIARFSPYEIERLPERCRPPRFWDGDDIADYAYTLVRHYCDDGEGQAYSVHKLRDFFSNATHRLSQIRYEQSGSQGQNDSKQSA